MGADKKWYVIHTYSSYENKVKTTLELKVQSMGMEDMISQILVPTEDIKDYDSKGNPKITKRKLYPGYVFVEMEVNDRSWYIVRNTPGVTGFVGSATKPVPLSEAEVARILGSQGADATPKYDINVGDTYIITEDGYRNGMVGTVMRVNHERNTVVLSIDINDTETEAEVGIIDITKFEE